MVSTAASSTIAMSRSTSQAISPSGPGRKWYCLRTVASLSSAPAHRLLRADLHAIRYSNHCPCSCRAVGLVVTSNGWKSQPDEHSGFVVDEPGALQRPADSEWLGRWDAQKG